MTSVWVKWAHGELRHLSIRQHRAMPGFLAQIPFVENTERALLQVLKQRKQSQKKKALVVAIVEIKCFTAILGDLLHLCSALQRKYFSIDCFSAVKSYKEWQNVHLSRSFSCIISVKIHLFFKKKKKVEKIYQWDEIPCFQCGFS